MMLLELKNVYKNFYHQNKKISVLKGVNIKFWYKGLYIIVGKSGSGKSTLLNIIAGLIEMTSGDYIFKGESLNYSSSQMSKFRNRNIGIVFQNYQLIDTMTPLQNVAFPLVIKGVSRNVAERKALLLFKQFLLTDKINQNISTLSGGEKQRIAVMRAMITDPAFYILDEPTGALDSENGLLLMEMFKKIAETKLVIMVSHNERFSFRYADKVLYLKDGVISE